MQVINAKFLKQKRHQKTEEGFSFRIFQNVFWIGMSLLSRFLQISKKNFINPQVFLLELYYLIFRCKYVTTRVHIQMLEQLTAWQRD